MEEKSVVMPLLGDQFPSMQVKTTQGELQLPDAYKGKWFVLFSHPGDFTPVCTTEFYAFSKRADEFAALNTELIGLSVDQLQSHLKWVEWIDHNSDVTVPFPVIADELGLVATRLGMLHEGKGTNTVRAVYIVDDKGVLRLMLFYPQEIGRSVDEILRSLRALQVSGELGVACPENFPNNEFVGENTVIIPPAGTEEQKADREAKVASGEYQSKDWWLCYKKL